MEKLIAKHANFNKTIDNLIISVIFIILFFVPLYFAFFYKDISVFSLDKAVLFRILSEFLLILTLFKIILTKKFEINIGKWQFILPSLFILIYSLSTIFSYSPHTSFWGHYWRHDGLFTYWHYYLFYLLIFVNYKLITGRVLKIILIGIISSAFFVCLYGLVQFLGYDFFVWTNTTLRQRIASSLGQPNFTGAYLLLTLPASIGSLFIFKNFYAKLFISVSLGLEIIVLLLTYSRSSWIGLMAAVFVFTGIYGRINRSKKILYGLAGMILILASLAIFMVGQNKILNDVNYEVTLKNKIFHLFDFSTGSGYARLKSYPAFAKISLERPLLGFGPETMWLWFPEYYSNQFELDNTNNYFDRSHNETLDILLFTGFAGLIAYLSFIIYFLISSLKIIVIKENFINKRLSYIYLVSLAVGLTAYLVAIQFGFSVLTTNVYFWLYIALSFIIINKFRPQKEISYSLANTAMASRIYYILFTVVFLLASYIIWQFNINKVRADMHFFKAISGIVNKEDFISINNEILASLNLDPTEDYYRLKYSDSVINTFKNAKDCELKIKALNIAKSFIEEIPSSRLETYSRLNLLQAEAIISQCRNQVDLKNIGNLAVDTLSYMPNMPQPRIDVADIFYNLKEYDKAIQYLNSAIGLFPDISGPRTTAEQKQSVENFYVVVYKLLGDAYAAKGDWNKALNNYLTTQKFLEGQVNFDLRNKISDMYIRNGKLGEAIKMDGHSLILSNNDAYYKIKLMEDYYLAKDIENAKIYARLVLKFSPENELAKKLIENIIKH